MRHDRLCTRRPGTSGRLANACYVRRLATPVAVGARRRFAAGVESPGAPAVYGSGFGVQTLVESATHAAQSLRSR